MVILGGAATDCSESGFTAQELSGFAVSAGGGSLKGVVGALGTEGGEFEGYTLPSTTIAPMEEITGKNYFVRIQVTRNRIL